MRKIENEFEVITGITTLDGKVVVDVGCGTGELVRKLTAQGARVTGIDNPEMLAKAKEFSPVGSEKYVTGQGENIPVKDNDADIVIFFASFHHVPEPMRALKETRRILQNGGIAIFVEPVGKEGSYFELIRLVEDEREIQKLAYETIKKASSIGLENTKEEIVYLERSLADYAKLLDIFVDDEEERKEYLNRSREVTSQLCRDAGLSIDEYRFKSICRINVLRKGRGAATT